MRGYGAILGSLFERHTVHFAGRSRWKILSLFADADQCVPTNVEAATPAEDLHIRMVTYPTSSYDTSPEAPSIPGDSGGVPSLSHGRGGLLLPFLPMSTSADGMAGCGRETPCHIIRRGVLDFSQQGYFSSGGRVVADFRHLVVGVASP